jgi:hypothetical protein
VHTIVSKKNITETSRHPNGDRTIIITPINYLTIDKILVSWEDVRVYVVVLGRQGS